MTAHSSLWTESEYCLDCSGSDVTELAHLFHRRVWRTSLDEPGIALIRLPKSTTSMHVRRLMFEILEAMPVRFVPERLGRFDQQVTSRFHRDGAPSSSLLLLGYEASSIPSSVFVADAHRAALREHMSIDEYIARSNPMFPAGEAKLLPFVTRIDIVPDKPYILAINNSLLPFDGSSPLGLLHKAEVPIPDPTASRVINSMGLMLASETTATRKSQDEVKHFLSREDLD